MNQTVEERDLNGLPIPDGMIERHCRKIEDHTSMAVDNTAAGIDDGIQLAHHFPDTHHRIRLMELTLTVPPATAMPFIPTSGRIGCAVQVDAIKIKLLNQFANALDQQLTHPGIVIADPVCSLRRLAIPVPAGAVISGFLCAHFQTIVTPERSNCRNFITEIRNDLDAPLVSLSHDFTQTVSRLPGNVRAILNGVPFLMEVQHLDTQTLNAVKGDLIVFNRCSHRRNAGVLAGIYKLVEQIILVVGQHLVTAVNMQTAFAIGVSRQGFDWRCHQGKFKCNRIHVQPVFFRDTTPNLRLTVQQMQSKYSLFALANDLHGHIVVLPMLRALAKERQAGILTG